jgi:hypothetical protein
MPRLSARSSTHVLSLSVATFALLATVTTVRPAFADVDACLAQYEQGQRLRRQGKLLEGRSALAECARDECPATLRADCRRWLDELSSEVPSISVRVQGADGCDRPDATFTVDADPTRRRADALLVEVDPGPRVVRADVDGRTIQQSIVVSPRERGRIVTLFADPTATTCRSSLVRTAPAAPAERVSDASRESRPLSPLAIVLAGSGVVALGIGGGFAIDGWNRKSALDDCRGACQQEDVDGMNRSFLIGDVALGVGAAAIVVAAIVHLTR